MPSSTAYLRGDVPPKKRYSHTARRQLLDVELLRDEALAEAQQVLEECR